MTVTTFRAPGLLRLSGLSADEQELYEQLSSQLTRYTTINNRQIAYYEGSTAVRDLGIAIPPHLRDLEAVAAWPQIVVDVRRGRLSWDGWITSSDLGLDDLYRANHLKLESGMGILDALICGVSFIAVGRGVVADGEPDVVITAESPNHMTMLWDPRRRRARAALRLVSERPGGPMVAASLYLPNQTIRMEMGQQGPKVIDRDVHNLGRVPVARMANKPTTTRPEGRSEISRAIRSYTDSTVRTLLGMEVAREFYAAPQRWMMGADESMFVDGDGNRIDAWKATIGRLLLAPRDDQENLPQVGTFTASSPLPFVDQIRGYAQLVSAASGMPAAYLGFVSDNPASADAIRSAESRLDKESVTSQDEFSIGLVEAGEIALHLRNGAPPKPGSVQTLWKDPATATPAAAADFTQKMIAAGVLDPAWDVTLEGLGYSSTTISRIQVERRRSRGSALGQGLAAAALAARANPAVAALADRTTPAVTGAEPGGD